MADFTIGDALALTRDDKSAWGDGIVGWFILLFVFLLAISGNGLFGAGTSATQSSLTTAELYSALGNQDLKNDVRSGFASAMDRTYLLDKDILENRFTTQLGFQNAQAQMFECCCATQQKIVEDGEKTRALITNNYIEGLRTALSDAKDELSNRTQSSYLLNTLGNWYMNPCVNPNLAYNTCGCGCGNNLV